MRSVSGRFNEARINRLVGKIARHKHAHPDDFAGREDLYIKHAQLTERKP